MTLEASILAYWPIIGAIIGAIIWGIRMEGQVKALWKQREEDQRESEKSRGEVHELLTELRQDIKQLLSRGDSRK